jgi:hypothetical protein
MLTVRLKGGLGNQMFQYAFAKALSYASEQPFQLDLRFLNDRTPRKGFVFRNYDLDLFNVEPQIGKPLKYYPGQFYFEMAYDKIHRINKMPSIFRSTSIYYEKSFQFDKEILNNKKYKYFDGYFQSYKYFDNIKSEILSDFTFREKIEQKGFEMLDKIKNKNSICLNVRRGDFVNGKVVAEIPSSYHYRAVDFILDKIDDPNIFVFSDDINWCINNLKFQCPTTFVSHDYKGNRFRTYMELMINCKHFIIPNSTFAWWAAYLNTNLDKIVITPKNWFESKYIDTNDLVPDSWVIL